MAAVERDEFNRGLDRLSSEFSRGFEMIAGRVDRIDLTVGDIRTQGDRHEGMLHVLTKRHAEAAKEIEAIAAEPSESRRITAFHVTLVIGTILAVIAFLTFIGKLR